MLVGVVERRLTRRVPPKTEFMINFERNGQQTALATVNDISAGGIYFFVPWGTEVAQPGEIAEFVFNLPNIGETRIRGAIRQLRFGVDLDQNRIVYYGARFIDLPFELWNSLVDFCQAANEPEEPEPENSREPLKVERERLDFRIVTEHFPIYIIAPTGERTDGFLEDISFGGLKAKLPRSVPLQEEVIIGIEDAEYKSICLWVVPLEVPEVGFLAGYRFTDLSKEQFERLRSFIFGLASQTTRQ